MLLYPGLLACSAQRVRRVLATVGFLALSLGQAHAALYDSLVTAAQEAEAAGKLSIALETWRQAQLAAPQEPLPFVERPRLLVQAGQVSQARQEAQQAAARFPNRADTLLLIGKVQLAANDATAALQTFTLGLRANPNLPALYRERARAWRALGKRGEAERDLVEAIRLRLDDASISLEQAAAHKQAGRYREALKELDNALRLRPNDPAILLEQADVHSRLGDSTQVTALTTVVLALQPAFNVAYRLRAAARAEQGRHAEAVADYTAALRATPSDPALLLARAAAYTRQALHQEALLDLEQVITLQPADPQAYLLRAQSWQQLGATPRALADVKTALQLQPGWAEASRLQADLLQSGQSAPVTATDVATAPPSRAEQLPLAPPTPSRKASVAPVVSVSVPMDPDNAAALYREGRRLAEAGQFQQARDLLSQAILRDAQIPEYWNARGYAHLRLGHAAEAVQDFQKALSLRPDYAGAQQNLAMAQRRLSAPAKTKRAAKP